jgi:hypothetical protein
LKVEEHLLALYTTLAMEEGGLSKAFVSICQTPRCYVYNHKGTVFTQWTRDGHEVYVERRRQKEGTENRRKR